ncbi:MAG: DUF4428 domain-containing protein [Collinsella sp.]
MGFFDKMFEKKECAICGTELGLLGKTKINEGYLCKECVGKLSPFFGGYRSSTADDIREQLAYREANAERLASFNPTRTLSAGRTNIMLDEDAGLLIITPQSRWRDANPDIIEFSQVLGCDMDIDEHRTEIYRETKDGERESYNPPRYDLDYDFNLTIHVNTPYFTEINLRVNDSTIDQRGSIEYREAKRQQPRSATRWCSCAGDARQRRGRQGPQDRGHLPLLRCNYHSRCQWALRILRWRHRRIASGTERTDHGLRGVNYQCPACGGPFTLPVPSKSSSATTAIRVLKSKKSRPSIASARTRQMPKPMPQPRPPSLLSTMPCRSWLKTPATSARRAVPSWSRTALSP